MNAFPEDIWTYVKCLSFHNISLVMLPFMTTEQLYNTKCFALTCVSFNPWEGYMRTHIFQSNIHIFRTSQLFISLKSITHKYFHNDSNIFVPESIKYSYFQSRSKSMMDTAPSGNVYSGGHDKDKDKDCDNFSSVSTLHKKTGFPGRPRLARSACIEYN